MIARNKVYALYSCQDCQAGETCGKHEDVLLAVYATKELAQKALKQCINEHSGCYVEEDSATCYYDVCICDDPSMTPFTYQAYLKAGDWAGLRKRYIVELEIKESL